MLHLSGIVLIEEVFTENMRVFWEQLLSLDGIQMKSPAAHTHRSLKKKIKKSFKVGFKD